MSAEATLRNPFLSPRKVTKKEQEERRKAAILKSQKERSSMILDRCFNCGEDWSSQYVVLDTETTGIGDMDTITELSIISIDGKVLFTSLFNPQRPLDEKITKITGITDEMLKDAPLFAEKADEILEILTGKTVLGWNVGFDRKMVERAYSTASMSQPFCEWECAMKMYHIMRMDGKGKWPKLQEALNAEGIVRSQEHRATGDCYDTLAVLKNLAGAE